MQATVFDSRQLNLEMGIEVEIAAKAMSASRSLTETPTRLEAQIARTHVFAALDTLEYVRSGG